ncbi:MAG TPA: CocE/NonD family hydrolase C-terminal non-catalytic domain-containing protein [Rubrobacter sp.]|nr:CocE/NonD family hydrolase C-terminal non-catalytic domain-containing protein [Rubrobacter sp.]
MKQAQHGFFGHHDTIGLAGEEIDRPVTGEPLPAYTVIHRAPPLDGPGGTVECLGTGPNRSARTKDPPGSLAWESALLETHVDVVGDLELRLDASATAADTAWIALLQDVAPDGTVTEVTAGWLQASLHAVDEQATASACCCAATTSPGRYPTIIGFRHASVGTSSRNTVYSSSRLLLPVISSAAP